MRFPSRTSALALCSAAVLTATACASAPARHATSIVSYLYPNRGDHVEQTSVPTLALPLRVGVAFVPEDDADCHSCATHALAESERTELMKNVAAHFRDPAMVKSIEIIPSAYLSPKGSFANLDQLRSMFGVDVVALISYDQIQFTDQGRSSLTYWTLIGAYLVEGEKNDTRTLMDAVVYDIPSRKLLFRAPGVSSIRGSSTPVNQSEELRHDSERGFRDASADLIGNLDHQLVAFKEKVKESPEEYRVVKRGGRGGSGGTGSGSVDGWFAVLITMLGGVAAVARQRRVQTPLAAPPA